MSPEELDRLIHAYRDERLSREDGERLARALREGGDLSRRIRKELEFSGLLGQALEGPDEAAFLRSFKERVLAEETGTEFIQAFERRSPERRGRSPAPWHGWMAATLFLGGVLVLVAIAQRPAPDGATRISPSAPEMGRAADRSAEDLQLDSRPDSQVPPLVPVRPPLGPLPTPPLKDSPPLPAPVSPTPPERAREAPAVVAQALPPASHLEVESRPGVLTLAQVQGSVFRTQGQERGSAARGGPILAGEGLECEGLESSAVASFRDGTRLELGPETLIREVTERAGNRGKRLFLARGTLLAEVARQPAEAPLIIATPQGEARILGTKLRLFVDADPRGLTRLEVAEGKVRLSRTGGKSTDVGAGSTASCGPGIEPSARLIHPEEIVLLPSQAKLVGEEWVLVRDRNASSGLALEVAKSPYRPIDHVQGRPSYALFTFYASAERDYRLWIRTMSLAAGDRWLRDQVTVEPQNCTLSQRSAFFGQAPTTAYVFTGISTWNGYAWAGGVHEESKPEPAPLTVRFTRTGVQTLRLFTVQPSIRIDAVWLSARQAARPPGRQFPPPAEK
jgi:hypothetical protein